ncbi:putative Serine/threonine-protein kinase PRP4 [Paratrimastix pyriformis]|uniref:Serine/threonine-protein kinase PRP4 n=1 Tax=Paratrimastix pyriformis TaxID=342808 RepID=A0ABQ8ULT1_9EUKA|nr:putative Serine/threonine-protein kinase PRP4 [Paratrimastix pyriformis]
MLKKKGTVPRYNQPQLKRRHQALRSRSPLHDNEDRKRPREEAGSSFVRSEGVSDVAVHTTGPPATLALQQRELSSQQVSASVPAVLADTPSCPASKMVGAIGHDSFPSSSHVRPSSPPRVEHKSSLTKEHIGRLFAPDDEEDVTAPSLPPAPIVPSLTPTTPIAPSASVVTAAQPALPQSNLAPPSTSQPEDCDDEQGQYKWSMGDLLDGRYQITGLFGKGVFSTVVKATEITARGSPPVAPTTVAIKIIRAGEVSRQNGLKELATLQRISEAVSAGPLPPSQCPAEKAEKPVGPCGGNWCVRQLGHFVHRGHLCIVLEALGLNLREVQQRFCKNQGLNISAVRLFATMLLRALNFLHTKMGIVNCDVKPDNCIVNERRSTVKICDFGSCCDGKAMVASSYVVSRFYRAPEIILGAEPSFPVDMWSLGATLFELYTGRILFPGATNSEMLRLFQEVRGRIPYRVIKRSKFGEKYFDSDGTVFLYREVNPATKEAQRPLHTLLRRASGDALSPEDEALVEQLEGLLERCLALDPEKRITPQEALEHPFIASATARRREPTESPWHSLLTPSRISICVESAGLPPSRNNQMEVRLLVPYQTVLGQRLLAVGNLPSLGNWDPLHGHEMVFSPPDIWSATIDIPLKTPVEFKFVLLENSQAHTERSFGEADLRLGQGAGWKFELVQKRAEALAPLHQPTGPALGPPMPATASGGPSGSAAPADADADADGEATNNAASVPPPDGGPATSSPFAVVQQQANITSPPSPLAALSLSPAAAMGELAGPAVAPPNSPPSVVSVMSALACSALAVALPAPAPVGSPAERPAPDEVVAGPRPTTSVSTPAPSPLAESGAGQQPQDGPQGPQQAAVWATPPLPVQPPLEELASSAPAPPAEGPVSTPPGPLVEEPLPSSTPPQPQVPLSQPAEQLQAATQPKTPAPSPAVPAPAREPAAEQAGATSSPGPNATLSGAADACQAPPWAPSTQLPRPDRDTVIPGNPPAELPAPGRQSQGLAVVPPPGAVEVPQPEVLSPPQPEQALSKQTQHEQSQPQPEQAHPQPEQTQPEQAQSEQAQPKQTQPEQAQPQPEQAQPQPEQTQSEQAQPKQTQPEQAQPQPEQAQPQPEQTQPEQAQPEQAQPQPEQAQPQPEQAQPQPEQAQPEQAQSEQAQPKQTQPEQAQPQPEQAQPQPEQAQPQPEQAQPQPEQTQPQPEQTQPQPEQTQPEPEQTQPEQAHPQPEQTQPEQTQPEQTQPEQTQPEQTQPEQTQPEQTQPEQTQPEQTQPQPKQLEQPGHEPPLHGQAAPHQKRDHAAAQPPKADHRKAEFAFYPPAAAYLYPSSGLSLVPPPLPAASLRPPLAPVVASAAAARVPVAPAPLALPLPGYATYAYCCPCPPAAADGAPRSRHGEPPMRKRNQAAHSRRPQAPAAPAATAPAAEPAAEPTRPTLPDSPISEAPAVTAVGPPVAAAAQEAPSAPGPAPAGSGAGVGRDAASSGSGSASGSEHPAPEGGPTGGDDRPSPNPPPPTPATGTPLESPFSPGVIIISPLAPRPLDDAWPAQPDAASPAQPPVMEEKPPVKPPANEKPPVMEEKPPVMEEKPPVMEEKPSVMEEKPTAGGAEEDPLDLGDVVLVSQLDLDEARRHTARCPIRNGPAPARAAPAAHQPQAAQHPTPQAAPPPPQAVPPPQAAPPPPQAAPPPPQAPLVCAARASGRSPAGDGSTRPASPKPEGRPQDPVPCRPSGAGAAPPAPQRPPSAGGGVGRAAAKSPDAAAPPRVAVGSEGPAPRAPAPTRSRKGSVGAPAASQAAPGHGAPTVVAPPAAVVPAAGPRGRSGSNAGAHASSRPPTPTAHLPERTAATIMEALHKAAAAAQGDEAQEATEAHPDPAGPAAPTGPAEDQERVWLPAHPTTLHALARRQKQAERQQARKRDRAAQREEDLQKALAAQREMRTAAKADPPPPAAAPAPGIDQAPVAPAAAPAAAHTAAPAGPTPSGASEGQSASPRAGVESGPRRRKGSRPAPPPPTPRPEPEEQAAPKSPSEDETNPRFWAAVMFGAFAVLGTLCAIAHFRPRCGEASVWLL